MPLRRARTMPASYLRVAGSLLIVVIWLWVGAADGALTEPVVLIAVANGLLVLAVATALSWSAELGSLETAGVLSALGFLTLTKYTVFNIPPMFYPSDVYMTGGAKPEAFLEASVAALLSWIGFAAGILLTRRSGFSDSKRGSSPSLLPAWHSLIGAAVLVQCGLLYATFSYGAIWNNVGAAHFSALTFSLFDQVVVYGVFHSLPMAPIFAGLVYRLSVTRHQRSVAATLSVLFMLATVACLAVWRMRSWSMIALGCGVLLLTPKHRRVLVVASVCGCLAVAYTLVTAIRSTQATSVIAERGWDAIHTESFWRAATVPVATPGADDESPILTSFLTDGSYQWSGRDSSAAILHAYDLGRAEPAYGRITLAGFLAALPAALRPSNATAMAAKEAPIELGILPERDYVAPLLQEFVLDWGAYLLIFPCFFVGTVFGVLERLMLSAPWPWSEPLRVGRLLWLLSLAFAHSLATSTLMLLKATAGLLAAVLLLTLLYAVFRSFPLFRPRKCVISA